MPLQETVFNDTITTLTVAALATDTTFTVAAVPSGLTALTQSRVRIQNEYCLITYGSATTLTCVGGLAGRGLEGGSVASAHANGTEVDFVLTAGGLSALAQASVNLSGALLGEIQYQEAADLTTTSTTYVDIDDAHLALAIVVPASGNVDVTLSALVTVSGVADMFIAMSSSSGGAQLAGSIQTVVASSSGASSFVRAYYRARLTGLTPGALTLYPQWKVDGSTGTIKGAAGNGPVIITAFDATLASNGAIAVTAAMNSDEAQASIISANAASDHFFGSALAAKWTLENATTPVATVSNSAAAVSSASGATHMSTAYVPGASTALRVEARIQLRPNTANGCGLLIKDTATTESTTNGVLCAIDGAGVTFYNIVAGTFTAQGSALVPYGGVGGLAGWNYVRLSRDASNVWTAYYSRDRIAWVVVGATVTNATTIAKAAFRADPVGGSVDFIDVVDGTTGVQTGLVTALPPGVAGQILAVSASGVPVLASKLYGARTYSRASFI